MLRSMLVLTLVLAALCGCRCVTRTRTGMWPERPEYSRRLDEGTTRHVAEKRALVAIRKCYPEAGYHYKTGFIQAYVDVALGGTGVVPAVPPERYWSACHRNPEGHCAVTEWFDGYAAGAERALGSCWHSYNMIPASGACSAASGAGCGYGD